MTSRLRVTVNGVRYPSKDAAAKAFGKCSSTVHSIARRCNISFEEALVKKPEQKIYVRKGKVFAPPSDDVSPVMRDWLRRSIV